MKESSKEDLLNCFDGMCTFLAIHGWTERDERAVAIRKLIEGKIDLSDLEGGTSERRWGRWSSRPKVTKKFIEKWAYEIDDVWAGKIKESDFIIKLLDGAGVEVEE